MLIPRFTDAIITMMKYRARISLIIRVSVLGVVCSVNEWKFLNSAMLAVESFIEEEDEPVIDCD
jgi:hypothetical protein